MISVEAIAQNFISVVKSVVLLQETVVRLLVRRACANIMLQVQTSSFILMGLKFYNDECPIKFFIVFPICF